MSTQPIENDDGTRLYELCFLYPSNLSSNDEKALLAEIDEIFAEAKVTVVQKDAWGKHGLAYRIKGHQTGNYIVFYIHADPASVKEIDQNFRLLKNGLRHLIVKPPKGYTIESFADRYAQWQKEKKEETANTERAKEAAVKKRVAEKAKRQSKKKAETKENEHVDEAEVSQEIDKLIADDDLEL